MADELEFPVVTADCDVVAVIWLEVAGFSRHYLGRTLYQVIDGNCLPIHPATDVLLPCGGISLRQDIRIDSVVQSFFVALAFSRLCT